MRISMYMLEYWFREEHPVVHIEDGSRSIAGARLFTDAVYGKNDYLYVGEMGDFFPRKASHEVVLVYRKDVMCFASSDLDDIFNRVLAAFDFYEEMERRMLAGADSDRPEQCVISACEELLGPTFVMDPSYRILGCSQKYRGTRVNPLWDYFSVNHYPEIHSILQMRFSNVVQILKDPQYMREFLEPQAAPYHYGVVSSYTDHSGKQIGHLIIASDCAITPFDRDLMQIMLDMLQLIYSRRNQEESGGDSGEEKVLLSLLAGKGREKEVKVLRLLKGWEEKDFFRLLVMDSQDIPADVLLTAVKDSILQAIGHQGILVEQEGKACCLLRISPEQDQDARTAIPDAIARLPFKVGVSNYFSQLSLCPYYREQALEALRYSKDSLTEFHKIALTSVAQKSDPTYKRLACHPLTLFLAEYDREHKTEFSRTLCVYLMNERSLRKTAEQLFIHRNTVLYRLEKMRTLYAMYPDLAVPEERAYVLFSLLLLRALSVFG